MKRLGRQEYIIVILMFFILSIISGFVSKREPGGAEATEATHALHLVRNVLPLPQTGYITDLIYKGRLREFENLSVEYETAFKNDPLYESPLVKLYESINFKDPDVEKYLRKWVNDRPSYMSYSALGSYYANRGVYLRGEKYVSDTSEKRLREMRETLELAKRFLRKAIQRKDSFVPPYVHLIAAETRLGDHKEVKRISDQALMLAPESFYVRSNYLRAFYPRWGGSYHAMSDYLDAINFEQLSNPRIWQLKGEVEGERGFMAYLAKDYSEAIMRYSDALGYGDCAEFYLYRGYSYWYLREFENARDDLARYMHFVEEDSTAQKYLDSLNKRLN